MGLGDAEHWRHICDFPGGWYGQNADELEGGFLMVVMHSSWH